MPDVLNGECHTVFTTVENAHKLLLDDQGRFIPTEDICKVCRQPFTIDQKIALLHTLQQKQKEESLKASGYYNAKNKNLYVRDTSQGKAMVQWSNRGELPVERGTVKIRGQSEGSKIHKPR